MSVRSLDEVKASRELAKAVAKEKDAAAAAAAAALAASDAETSARIRRERSLAAKVQNGFHDFEYFVTPGTVNEILV